MNVRMPVLFAPTPPQRLHKGLQQHFVAQAHTHYRTLARSVRSSQKTQHTPPPLALPLLTASFVFRPTDVARYTVSPRVLLTNSPSRSLPETIRPEKKEQKKKERKKKQKKQKSSRKGEKKKKKKKNKKNKKTTTRLDSRERRSTHRHSVLRNTEEEEEQEQEQEQEE